MSSRSKYGSEDPFDSYLVKFYNLPLYVLRKLDYYLCYVLLTVVDFLASPFFFRYDLEEDAAWKWFTDVELPRYRVERED
ncbi:MAG: hypothetical protein ABEJ56_00035 [Candidatus Nanohaloarchaea archaeon]